MFSRVEEMGTRQRMFWVSAVKVNETEKKDLLLFFFQQFTKGFTAFFFSNIYQRIYYFFFLKYSPKDFW